MFHTLKCTCKVLFVVVGVEEAELGWQISNLLVGVLVKLSVICSATTVTSIDKRDNSNVVMCYHSSNNNDT